MKKTIEAIQQALKNGGYYGGHIDGDFGRQSHAALDAAKAAAKNPVSLSQTKSQFKLSQTSLDRLQGVNERLVMLVHRALELSTVEFMVVEGLRTKQRQHQLYAQGRTSKGPIVTWTLNSKHIDGLAVDVAPVVEGKIDWNDSKKFDAIAKAMFMAAAELGVKIRWGADWNRNDKPREKGESDSPHFELV